MVIAVASLAGAAASASPPRDRDLTESEARRLAAHELVVKDGDAPGFPWPETTVYRRVRASPEEVMAVYVDFDNQSRYLPDLVECRTVRRLGPNRFHVYYEYEVPGPNERYTVEVTIARTEAGFWTTWELIEAPYARRLSGEVRAEPLGTESLVVYVNRVDPGVLGAVLGSPASVSRRLQATVQALAARVERLKTDEPEALSGLVRKLGLIGGDRRVVP